MNRSPSPTCSPRATRNLSRPRPADGTLRPEPEGGEQAGTVGRYAASERPRTETPDRVIGFVGMLTWRVDARNRSGRCHQLKLSRNRRTQQNLPFVIRPSKNASSKPKTRPGWITTRSAPGGPGTPTSPCRYWPWRGWQPAGPRPQKGNQPQQPGHDRLHGTGDPPAAHQPDPGPRTRPRGTSGPGPPGGDDANTRPEPVTTGAAAMHPPNCRCSIRPSGPRRRRRASCPRGPPHQLGAATTSARRASCKSGPSSRRSSMKPGKITHKGASRHT